MTFYCDYYGHDYSKNLYVSSKLPAGYVYEECTHCGKDRTVYEPGVGNVA